MGISPLHWSLRLKKSPCGNKQTISPVIPAKQYSKFFQCYNYSITNKNAFFIGFWLSKCNAACSNALTHHISLGSRHWAAQEEHQRSTPGPDTSVLAPVWPKQSKKMGEDQECCVWPVTKVTKMKLGIDRRMFRLHKGMPWVQHGHPAFELSSMHYLPTAWLPLKVKESNNGVCHQLFSHAWSRASEKSCCVLETHCLTWYCCISKLFCFKSHGKFMNETVQEGFHKRSIASVQWSGHCLPPG